MTALLANGIITAERALQIRSRHSVKEAGLSEQVIVVAVCFSMASVAECRNGAGICWINDSILTLRALFCFFKCCLSRRAILIYCPALVKPLNNVNSLVDFHKLCC